MKKIFFLLILLLAFFLRFFKLGENPVSLYWDEVSLGYNAYTIATSLRDEHGEFMPLARFIAFGDYKPPGYIYATVPSVLLLGLNEFAVRFPSMLAGLLMVIVSYYLTKELFESKKIALLASLILAVSPWGIHFSRAAFEANLAAFLNLAGIYFFVISKRVKPAILLSLVFFILSFYTFNANRIIAPLLLLGLSVIYFKDIFVYPSTPGESLRNTPGVSLRWIILSILVAIILILPSASYLTSRESRLRFQEVSIFTNLEPIELSNKRIELDGNSWWAKVIHNRRILFASDFLKHYFDNFSGRFLFTHGDVNPRLAGQTMGQLYGWDLPFLLIGIYFLVKRKEKAAKILFLWMLVSPIPAGAARETPHALRILSILPTFQIIIAYGLYQLWVSIKRKFIINSSTIAYCFILVLSALLSFNIYYYLHDYYIHYPRDWSGEWQYGYREMVNYVSSVENKYDEIYITNALGRPYIYFAFYQKLSLVDFLSQRTADRDWFGFWDVKALGKIKFDFRTLPGAKGKILLVNTPKNLPADFKLVEVIKNPKGDDVFWIGEKI